MVRHLLFGSLLIIFATLAGCASSQPEQRKRTNQFDTDGDGFLTPEEYSASALSKVVEFESLDRDNDGLLSIGELEYEPRRDMRERHSRGGKGRRPTELAKLQAHLTLPSD